ncbi:DUF5691 domain-containing protein [Rivularia sp. UHCC 0363]|uniref:DUF5691 domain-containing protein n=1 Tax=Rivularia sp. UHCC 0363 TaxID=3110244 RepID=UPI002B21A94E|nr:DUF5691 domain-containing protein [Rivularia sp. UHCC 0363]MEA5596183.1 DUF5691 domain-containing protein [Rivularia sp. UHCC 0363]
MNIWQDLVKTAVVGTQRQDLKITPLDNQLGKVLNGVDINDKEGSLLSAAGTISLYQQAGKLTAINNKITLKTCELDDLPYCKQSEQHLKMMLSGEYSAILPEWLKLTASAKKVVSPKYLPELLTLGKRQQNLRKDILPVLGKRGIWLAAQNPDWNYVIGENIDNIWKSGSLEARRNLLEELRQSEAQKGRKQLQNIWSKEKASERAILLEGLKVGLSIDDEAFLEDALEDRSKQVRDVAARLLAQIPESKLVKRMIKRVRPLLNLHNNNIEVTLPQKCTLEMTQDGIDESKYIPSLGEKASLLLQMLTSVPPTIWSDDWKKTPTELIKIIADSKWEKLFLEAWTTATVRSKDIVWTEAFLKSSVRLYQNLNHIDNSIINFLRILPCSEVETLILDVLQQSDTLPFNFASPAFPLLIHTPHIWNEEISRTVISSIKSCIENNNQVNNWQFGLALGHFSVKIAPSIYHEAAEILNFEESENIHKSLTEAIDKFLAKLQFRYEMRKAILM